MAKRKSDSQIIRDVSKKEGVRVVESRKDVKFNLERYELKEYSDDGETLLRHIVYQKKPKRKVDKKSPQMRKSTATTRRRKK